MKDLWMEELQKQKKSIIKKVVTITLLIIITIVIVTAILLYLFNLSARKWIDYNIFKKRIEQGKTRLIELDGDEEIQAFAYDKYVCVYRKQSAEIYNKYGEKVSTIQTSINKPIFAANGRYLVIAEENGQKFYLISSKDKIYEGKIEGKIEQIKLNSNGYVGIVISNSGYKAVVAVFNKAGKEIIRTNLAKTRVADICISQDGKYLAIGEVDISGIIIQSSVKIISIENAKIDSTNAIIGEYQSKEGKLILNIEYQEKNNLVCMFDDSICVLENNKIEEKMQFSNKKMSYVSIELNDKVMLLEEISTGEYTSDSHISIFNTINLKEKIYDISNIAKNVDTYGNKIAINLGLELHIIDIHGFLVKLYESKKEINDVILTDKIAVVVYNDEIDIIDL